LVFNTQANTNYHIAVDGYYSSSFGNYELSLVFEPAPVNDNFTNRITLSGANLTTTGTCVAATKESGEPAHAAKAGGHSVWWTWSAPGNGRVTLATAGSTFDTLLAVYTGASVSTLVAKASNDDATGSDTTSLVSLDVTAGTNYHIAVDGYNGGEGLVELSLFFSPSPPNDDFANRIPLAGDMVTTSGSSVGATRETGEPNHGGYPSSHSVWWSWAAPTNGMVQIAATGDFSNVLGVYVNDSLAGLLPVASSQTSGTAQSVSFLALAGRTYQIAVDGKNGASGNIALTLSIEAMEINPGITSLEIVYNDVRISFSTIQGCTYRVERTDTLFPPVIWTPVLEAEVVPGTGGIVSIIDPAGAVAPQRFYRVQPDRLP
jgi:hypothetical protein